MSTVYTRLKRIIPSAWRRGLVLHWLGLCYWAATTRTFLRAWLTRKPLVLVGCHFSIYNGNAFFFLKNTCQVSDLCIVGVAHPRSNLSLLHSGLPWVPKGGRMARILSRRARVAMGTMRPMRDIGPEVAEAIQFFLFHGMPIKGIMKQQVGYIEEFPEIDYAIATSPLTARSMATAFRIAPGRVLQTGEPKTDGLVEAPRPILRVDPERSYRKVILYAPTHREEVHPSKGGRLVAENVIERVLQSPHIRDVLQRQQACMIIVPHPEIRNLIKTPIEPPFYLSMDLNMHTEHLMAGADVLISDYSSVIMDWLLLSRPLGLFCPDIEEYRVYRGFPYFDYEQLFGAMMVKTTEALAVELDRMLVGPGTGEELRKLKGMFHQFEAGGASQRVLERVRDLCFATETRITRSESREAGS